jgi:hypothetical protein
VKLASSPGSVVRVWLEGKRSAALFCPDGRPGAFASMRDAVLAAPAGGTVAVCDGTWDVDTVRIDKPLTIRSQNPHGATLRDSDPNVVGVQQGRPALLINGVTSGTVRIVDLTLAPKGRGISVQQTFDQVVIDSSRFAGRDINTAIGVEVFANDVPTGKVEVRNSDFDHVSIGVFIVEAVETNVHHSHFQDLNGGAVTFSGTAGHASFGSATDNTIINCVLGGCIRVRAADPRGILIARNHIEGPDALTQPGGGVDVTPLPGADGWVTVEDNVIVSHRVASQRANVAAGWSLQSGVRVSGPGTANIVRRNIITDVFQGLEISGGIDAHDNVATGGFLAFRQNGIVAATVRRNDFTGQISTFVAPNNAAAYQCNWWGSASGPLNPPTNVNGTSYAPWALQPIANTAVACDPSPLMTVRVCSTVAPNTWTVATIAQAYSIVGTGGTILVCDGTHSMQNMSISKSITMTAEGPVMPTIDVGSAPRAFSTFGVVGGPVKFTNLRWTGSTAQIMNVAANSGTVIITGNEFHPNQTNPYGVSPKGAISGIVFNGLGIKATVDNNTFIDGDFGISTVPTPDGVIAITNNTFSGQVNNGVSQSTTAAAGSWTISGNSFTDCADPNCMFLPWPTTVTNNTFTIRIERPLNSVINAGQDALAQTGYVFTDNTFIGVGNAAGSRSSSTTYPIRSWAISLANATADMSRNRITNAFQGLGGRSGASITGSDNVVKTTSAPFGSSGTVGPTSFTLSWNDFSDYVFSVSSVTSIGTVNARCNWWGAATGPTSVPAGFSASSYTPFATAPVAGQSHSGCTP